MDYIDLEQFKKLPEYNDFLEKNSGEGILKIQAYTADQGLPIKDTDISVSKEIDAYVVLFYVGKTDENGMIDNIILPTPTIENQKIYQAPAYEIYNVLATNEQYKIYKNYKVGIFDNEKTIQNVKQYTGESNE